MTLEVRHDEAVTRARFALTRPSPGARGRPALRRATDTTAAEARETFLAYWSEHGRQHFRLEEELLFPAYAGHGNPHDPLVLRALGEHALIRHRAAALAATPSADPGLLEQLGSELAAHVRLEEARCSR